MLAHPRAQRAVEEALVHLLQAHHGRAARRQLGQHARLAVRPLAVLVGAVGIVAACGGGGRQWLESLNMWQRVAALPVPLCGHCQCLMRYRQRLAVAVLPWKSPPLQPAALSESAHAPTPGVARDGTLPSWRPRAWRCLMAAHDAGAPRPLQWCIAAQGGLSWPVAMGRTSAVWAVKTLNLVGLAACCRCLPRVLGTQHVVGSCHDGQQFLLLCGWGCIGRRYEGSLQRSDNHLVQPLWSQLDDWARSLYWCASIHDIVMQL